jgi:hypothetical protein
MKARERTILGQPSWVVASDQVELAITEQGGHMAPVVFYRSSGRPVQPYYISPWQGKGVRTGVPVLDPLRGDFFCMPFGGGKEYRGENHPFHGESASARWRLVGALRTAKVTELRLSMSTEVRKGRITKRLRLVDGQNAVYCQHVIDGCEGRMSVSHHATLAVPEAPRSLRVSSSPIRFGMTPPRKALANDGPEYYALSPGKRFSSIGKVPTIWKDAPFQDCSTHPRPAGFMDLIAIYSRPGAGPSWIAAAVPDAGYLWFALKDPHVLPQTVFWMDNTGRHAPPWSGGNRCLGLEDGRSYFATSLTDSAKRNELNAAGVPTVFSLKRERPLLINYIQGVARIPKSFDRVKSAAFGRDTVRFTAWSGKRVEVAVHWGFVYSGEIGKDR